MWSYLAKQLRLLNPDNEELNKNSLPKSRPLQFQELKDRMGDFSDLSEHDTAFKFWIPEPVEQALNEMSNRYELSGSEFLRQFLVIHCYGLYAFMAMQDANPKIFKDADMPRFSANSADRKKRIDTYWVAELGKNVAPIKVWIPSRLRNDLLILANHVGLTPSNYVREILISRLLGHGMLPKRPEMIEAIPTNDAESWCEGRDMEWREVSEEEFFNYKTRKVKPTFIEEDGEDA
jgi:hypothetical protein